MNGKAQLATFVLQLSKIESLQKDMGLVKQVEPLNMLLKTN